MAARRYHLGQRAASVEQTRAKIVAAARSLLIAKGTERFTVDALARKADVARQTIYYQFRTKTGVLEAVFDDLAERNRLSGLGKVFGDPDPQASLIGFVRVFLGFWETERRLLRRLRALAALDPELDVVMRTREERRRQGAAVLVTRLAPDRALTDPQWLADRADLIFSLTGFDTFDTLAGGGSGGVVRDRQAVLDLILPTIRLVLAAPVAGEPTEFRPAPAGASPTPTARDPRRTS